MSTPQHCPGFENFKHLKSFTCNCPKCGEVKEIFSDEFEKLTPVTNAVLKSISPPVPMMPVKVHMPRHTGFNICIITT